MSVTANLRHLVANYVFGRVQGKPSTSRFWYLPEPAAVFDGESATRYFDDASPSPRYVMNYRAKLRYDYAGEDGIIRLNYGGTVGTQINPLAAFEWALGCHDRFRDTGSETHRATFLRYAEHFRADQSADGHFLYRFRWFQSPAPWSSALAQSRGASVMLRAWMLTGDERYADAARAALRDFERPVDEGGFLVRHRLDGVPYFEEYPAQPTAAINGFLAALFGPFEVGYWLNDADARGVFERGLDALERLLPHYTTSWWTLYDFDPDSPLPNVHSPRYHRMVTDYLRVLAAISGRAAIAAWRDEWAARDTGINRTRAYALKAYKKIVHR